MRRFLAAGFLALAMAAAAPASAETLFRVTGVGLDDVLNVRAKPDAAAEQLTQLSPFDVDVKVLKREGDWAEIAILEEQADGSLGHGKPIGWVNAKFLTENTTPAELNVPLQCFGSDPLWAVILTGDGKARLATPDGGAEVAVSLKREAGGASLSFDKGGEALIKVDAACEAQAAGSYRYSFEGKLPVAGDASNSFVLKGCCR